MHIEYVRVLWEEVVDVFTCLMNEMSYRYFSKATKLTEAKEESAMHSNRQREPGSRRPVSASRRVTHELPVDLRSWRSCASWCCEASVWTKSVSSLLNNVTIGTQTPVWSSFITFNSTATQ